jgi:hypothetical protein
VTLHLPIGAIALTDAQFAEGTSPVLITSQNCLGTEESLTDCTNLGDDTGSCGRFEDAGIVCQGMAMGIQDNGRAG